MLFFKGSFDERLSSLEVGVKRNIGKYTEVRQSLAWNSLVPLCSMNISVFRKLMFRWPFNTENTNFTGGISLLLGFFGGIKASLQQQCENFSWLCTVEVHAAIVRLHASFTKMVTNTTWLTLGFRLENPWNWQLAFGGGRQLSKLSKTDISVEMGSTGISWVFGFSRWGQTFRFPVLLYSVTNIETALAVVVYSFFCAFCANSLVIDSLKENNKQEKLQLKRNMMQAERTKAQQWLRGMKNSIEQQRAQEEEKSGLVILHASYGNLAKRENFDGIMSDRVVEWSMNDINEEEENDSEILNVTDQLQYQIEKSELHLFSHSKSELPGFYDPCTGHSNYLDIIYSYKFTQHRVIISDDKELHITPTKNN